MPSHPYTVKKEGDHTIINIETSGCLFDLDGTLMLSSDSIEAFWRDFGKKYNIDAEELLKTSHGRRTIEMFQIFKPEFANQEDCNKFEGTIPKNWKHLAKPVPGVHRFLESLPADRWGIVTSGTSSLAYSWVDGFLKIHHPEVFITAEDIKVGKPDPTGYRKGHDDLGLSDKFLVFEDAPAGIKAGKSAGATVIGMATTYDAKTVKEAGADIVIPNLEHIKVTHYDPKTKEISLTITDPLLY